MNMTDPIARCNLIASKLGIPGAAGALSTEWSDVKVEFVPKANSIIIHLVCSGHRNRADHSMFRVTSYHEFEDLQRNEYVELAVTKALMSLCDFTSCECCWNPATRKTDYCERHSSMECGKSADA